MTERDWDVFSVIRRARTWIRGKDITIQYAEQYGRSLSYGAVYTICRRLVEAELVETRVRCGTDGRFRVFRQTTKGSGTAIPEKTRGEKRFRTIPQPGTA